MTLANRITLFRLAVIPVFCGLLFAYTPEQWWNRRILLILFILAALSDALDGYVARRLHQVSALGKRLDPLADKLLINFGFVFMAANPAFTPTVPLWFPVAILARDVFIVIGAYWINEHYGPVRVIPRWPGKITTAMQMLLLSALLLALPGTGILLWITLVFSVYSAADYFSFGWAQVAEKDSSHD